MLQIFGMCKTKRKYRFFLYKDDNAGYNGYVYCLTIDIAKDGLVEREYQQYFFVNQYSDAKLAFNRWTQVFELEVSD